MPMFLISRHPVGFGGSALFLTLALFVAVAGLAFILTR